MNEDMLPGMERRLVDALQPIRNFVLAHALHQFMETGVQEDLVRDGASTVAGLAASREMDQRRLHGFLRYLANEGYVRLGDDGTVSVTDQGREIGTFRPWYALLVGGYAGTLTELGDVLTGAKRYAHRDSFQVGAGSCGISQFDALPMTRRLLERIAGGWRTVVDLGCGDGRYLVDLCASLPDMFGVGLDVDARSIARAQQLAREHGVADRISLRPGSAAELPDLSGVPEPICFVTAFLLQELLEQADRTAIVDILRAGFARHPTAYWIVVEVDHRPADPAVMSHALGLAYYNPYYLIHEITEQRLETRAFWEAVFAEAGLRILAVELPDPAYDSLGLKLGYLLAPSDRLEQF